MTALPDYVSATFRGLTGWDDHHTRAGIAFSTFDGGYHQFVLSDLDLRRIGIAIAEAFPHLQFGPHGHRTGVQS